jgi:ubiquitin-conjugating enzyme E2 variant
MSSRVSSGGKSWEPATAFDVVSAGVFVVLLAPFGIATATALIAGHGVPWIVLAAPLGLLAADFITGALHWLCDTFFAEDTPIIGHAVIESFREHHRDQLAMTRRAFLRVSNSNVVATSVVLALVWSRRAVASESGSVFADAFITSLACSLMGTNQFHKWAHVARVPRIVARLQALGLILSPREHARHHRGDHSRAFCVTTGWLNPLLDGARFFTTCEWLVVRARRAITWRPSGGRTSES